MTVKKIGALVFFYGKMGAGKSTRAAIETAQRNAVLLSEDCWLQMLFPEDIQSIQDYLTYSRRIKPLVKSTVINVLSTGTNVVMDFPANTKTQRQWFLELADDAGAQHTMIYLDIEDQRCLEQIAKRRREQPERAAFDTESTFHTMTKYFEPPVKEESINTQIISTSSLLPEQVTKEIRKRPCISGDP